MGTMYKLVVLSACVAAAYAVADPVQVYAGGLPYGAAYQGFAGVPAGYAAGYAAAPVAAYAAAPVAAAPAAPAVPAAYAASLPAPAQIPIPQPDRLPRLPSSRTSLSPLSSGDTRLPTK